MNGLLRIRQRYQGLAQSDKKLADYLLHFLVINNAIRKLSKQHKPGGHYTRILYSDQFFHQRFTMTNTFWCQFQILLNQRNEQQIR